jgi:hypothetical protein
VPRDTGIILGKVNKAVCAGHDGFVWSMNAADGGSFEDPQYLYGQMIDADVTIGHSGIFSPDGKVIVLVTSPAAGRSRAAPRPASPFRGASSRPTI